MEIITTLLDSTGLSPESASLLSLLLAFLAFVLLFHRLARLGKAPTLRPIPAYGDLDHLLEGAMENGRAVHVSLGTQGIGRAATADTLAGLEVLEHLVEKLAGVGIPLTISVADPTLLPVAQDILRQMYGRLGYPEGYNPHQVQFLAPDAVAYSAAAMGLLARENVGINILIGSFGEEFLLLGESAAQRGIIQVGGTSSPQILPLVQVSMDRPLLGEEIYAAGAYLSSKPSHLASLWVQDWLRMAIVLAIFLGALILTVL